MEKNKEALWSAGTLFVEVGRVAGVVIGEPRSGGWRGSSWSPATVVSIKKKARGPHLSFALFSRMNIIWLKLSDMCDKGRKIRWRMNNPLL